MNNSPDIITLIQSRINHINYLLCLQNGDFYYMNSVKLTPSHIQYLVHHFPLKVNSVVRMGLSIGSLLNLPITSAAKVNKVLQHIVNVFSEIALTDEVYLDTALNNLEEEFAMDIQREQNSGRQHSFGSHQHTRGNNTNSRHQPSQSSSRRLKSSRSIGDLNKLLNLNNDTLSPKSESNRTPGIGAGARNFGSPSFGKFQNPASPSPTGSPARQHDQRKMNTTPTKQKVTPNRLTSTLRKMKSSNTLLLKSTSNDQLHGHNTKHEPLPQLEIKNSKLELSASNNKNTGSFTKHFSEKNFPINFPMDAMYSLNNFLTLLLKFFEKLLAYINENNPNIMKIKAMQKQHADSLLAPSPSNLSTLNIVASNSSNTIATDDAPFDFSQPPATRPLFFPPPHSNNSFTSLTTSKSSSSMNYLNVNDRDSSLPYNGTIGSPTTTKSSVSNHSTNINSNGVFSTPGAISKKQLYTNNGVTPDNISECSQPFRTPSGHSHQMSGGYHKLSFPSSPAQISIPPPPVFQTPQIEGINTATVDLLKSLDVKIQKDVFEPIFEVFDTIGESVMHHELDNLIEILGRGNGNDDDFF
ncbi:hypothetical protein DASC09_003280 [Saccharomycopsis crataegensis]|uniref:Uncharacterized protein n=1 Tax=Saccharomycopsis crataegensis TaxID=43959 RepID=A0AAV5QDU8_9ASCO|nr:hypothetical protein DASC09_003280 [Saccharomycopsis crataegensis]